MGVPTSIMYTFFMILHLSLILTFINYCQLFMMVVDLVMVFLYVIWEHVMLEVFTLGRMRKIRSGKLHNLRNSFSFKYVLIKI